jgi:peroxiredoxin
MKYRSKILLSLFTIITAIGFGHNDPDSISLNINLNTHSTIELNFRNATDSMILQAGFFTFFPANYVDPDPLKFQGNGKIYLDLKIQMPQKVSISIAFVSPKSAGHPPDTLLYNENRSTTCFLVPGDTLHITIDFSKRVPLPRCIEYAGKWAQASDYYKNKEIFFHRTDFIGPKGMTANMAPDYESFTRIIDSLTQVELDYLKNYDHKSLLPKWFVDYEESDIIYFAYSIKISEPMLMKRMRGIDEPVPKDYYSFLKERPLNNQAAILSVYYFLFLDFYFSMIQMPFTDSTQKDTTFHLKQLKGFIANAVKSYDENISDLLLAYKLDEGISNTTVPEEVYTLYTNAIHSPELRQYLEYRYRFRYVLKEGDKAPYFYLKNERNENISLKDFAGNIVYITFWFTGCKPCIKEIPDENRLVEIFKNDKVKIVSICMNSSEESWRECIEKYGIKSVALLCRGNWEKILKEKYDVNAFPQHVLIDKHGKIIVNKLPSVSEAEQEIRKYLAKE